MEIKNTLARLGSYTTTFERTGNAKATAGNTASTATGSTAKGDTISLSPEALLRTEALTAATAAPDIRQAKVDAIKARVQDGSYQIDSKQLASKLLTEEPGLFRP